MNGKRWERAFTAAGKLHSAMLEEAVSAATVFSTENTLT
jgi:hypothetical protein